MAVGEHAMNAHFPQHRTPYINYNSEHTWQVFKDTIFILLQAFVHLLTEMLALLHNVFVTVTFQEMSAKTPVGDLQSNW